MIARRICLVTGLVALTAAGCSTQPATTSPTTVYVTRTPSPPATTGQAPAGTSSAPGDTSGSTPGTTVTMRHLPGTCDDLLPAAAIDNALGRSLGGQTAFVVGLPEKDIGRIGYLNCRYGLSSANAAAKAEIGISLYTSAARAAARIPATVDDYSNHGARSSSVTVKGHRASVLTGGKGTGYTEPTLVVAAGQRTVAVSVRESAGARARKDLSALAVLALQKTAG